MRVLRFLLSPSGMLGPRAFVPAVLAVYVVGAASQLLTTPDVVARGGLWLFAAAQAVLTWAWYALHAKRLRDSGRAVGLAVGVSLLYALSVVLFLIVAAAFFTSLGAISDTNASSWLGLVLMISIVAALSGSPSHDFGWFIVAILTAMAFVPIIVALILTLWAATRTSLVEREA